MIYKEVQRCSKDYKEVQGYPNHLHAHLLSLCDAQAFRDEACVTSDHLVVHKRQHKHHGKEGVGMGYDPD